MKRLLINDNVVIDKTDIHDHDAFKELLNTYSLSIASENSEHYILEGYATDLDEFARFWADTTLE